jgi:hypothetical protein
MKTADYTKVNRFELIDRIKGRLYVSYDCEIELNFQDEGKTLKVFVRDWKE